MHVLDKFKYCPACGSSGFEEQDEKSKRCKRCGFEYYLNPSAAVAAFILNSRGQLLTLRRSKAPAKGTLDLPGGFVDIGENINEALMREVKEETGLIASLISSPLFPTDTNTAGLLCLRSIHFLFARLATKQNYNRTTMQKKHCG